MKKEKARIGLYYKIILALGLAASVLWIAFIDTKPFSDFKYYYDLAVNIANGLPWGDTYTSVGYSIILGGIFKIFGASVFKAKLLNLIFTFIGNLCFLSIINHINLKEKERKILFAIFVFMPNNIFYNSILGTEILFNTILLSITALYFGQVKYRYIYIGILTGINTMIKPFFIVFFFAVFLVELLKDKNIFKSIKNSMVVMIMCVLIISPWIYRNTKLIGQLTYVSNNGGIVLYINNNSQNTFGRWMPAEDVENSIVRTKEYKEANSTVKNKMLSNAAKDWIKGHPKQFITLGFKRLFNTYFVGDDVLYSTHGAGLSDNNIWLIYKITNSIRNIVFGSAIAYILFYSFFIIRCIFMGETQLLNKFNLYVVVIFFMFTSVYFITEGQGRYSFPEIFIMIYCFYSFVKFLIWECKELIL